MPYRRPINVVVGSPIAVEKTSDPTKEQIEELHSTYIKALKKLYKDYNQVYGDPNVELLIA